MKKKILFVIWSMSYGGGAEKVLSNLIGKMDLEKYEIDLLEFYHTDIDYENISKKINILKPIIDSTKITKTHSRFLNILVYIAPNIIRRKYDKKYDFEIAFNYQIPSFLLKKNSKSISWVHCAIDDLESNLFLRYKQKRAWEKTDYIVVTSIKAYDSVRNVYPKFSDKIKVIYNGCVIEDIVEMASKKTENDIYIENNSLFFIGRFEKRKNPLFCLNVCREIIDKYGVHLYMVGFGPLEEEIKEFIRANKLEKYVHLLGYLNNPYHFLKKSKGLLLFSKNEGFSTIILEALTIGIPFVSTDVGGAIELSNDSKCGFIIESKEQAIDAIEKLLFNRPDNIEQICKSHANKFNVLKQNEALEILLDELECRNEEIE